VRQKSSTPALTALSATFPGATLPSEQVEWQWRSILTSKEYRDPLGSGNVSKPETSLVALRVERDRCIDMLTEAFSKDLLDIDEFEDRVDLAHQASTVEALVALRKDLELTTPESSEALVPVETDEEQEALIAARPRSKWCISILGGSERKGQWRVPERLRVVNILGGTTLDFREAIFAPGVTQVTIVGCLGGVDIIVPPTLAVECEGAAIIGGFEALERCPAVPDPAKPLLRISGLALIGGIDVSTRLPGESARQARKRRRRERHRSRHERRARLPR
jgi:hypothetical protein